MIKNFFTVAFRNILRNKGFSIINISGLAIGMASAMLILLWVQNELSYDNFIQIAIGFIRHGIVIKETMEQFIVGIIHQKY